jgi:hypothetical protein
MSPEGSLPISPVTDRQFRILQKLLSASLSFSPSGLLSGLLWWLLLSKDLTEIEGFESNHPLDEIGQRVATLVPP